MQQPLSRHRFSVEPDYTITMMQNICENFEESQKSVAIFVFNSIWKGLENRAKFWETKTTTNGRCAAEFGSYCLQLGACPFLCACCVSVYVCAHVCMSLSFAQVVSSQKSYACVCVCPCVSVPFIRTSRIFAKIKNVNKNVYRF